jgi:hypothetical protein
MVRARGEPDAVAGKVRDTLSELDRRQPVHSLFPMEALIEAALEEPRMISSLLSFFAVLALALALVGVYGLVSLLVASRTREIATRIAFGATPSRIFFAVLREGASLVAVGLGSGLVVTVALPDRRAPPGGDGDDLHPLPRLARHPGGSRPGAPIRVTAGPQPARPPPAARARRRQLPLTSGVSYDTLFRPRKG